VQEGNQLRRAGIGFGAGHTELQVVVDIDDLAAGAPKPMYTVETKADSGKLPGAVITLNPYVAAARFVIASGTSTAASSSRRHRLPGRRLNT
jgi:hypothetical protein